MRFDELVRHPFAAEADRTLLDARLPLAMLKELQVEGMPANAFDRYLLSPPQPWSQAERGAGPSMALRTPRVASASNEAPAFPSPSGMSVSTGPRVVEAFASLGDAQQWLDGLRYEQLPVLSADLTTEHVSTPSDDVKRRFVRSFLDAHGKVLDPNVSELNFLHALRSRIFEAKPSRHGQAKALQGKPLMDLLKSDRFATALANGATAETILDLMLDMQPPSRPNFRSLRLAMNKLAFG